MPYYSTKAMVKRIPGDQEITALAACYHCLFTINYSPHHLGTEELKTDCLVRRQLKHQVHTSVSTRPVIAAKSYLLITYLKSFLRKK